MRPPRNGSADLNCYIRIMFSTREQTNAIKAVQSHDSGIFGGRNSTWMWAIVLGVLFSG